jgi:hypothetical protein
MCNANQNCVNGSCVTPPPMCNATTCPSGCCMGNVCQPGNALNACGAAGNTCQTCNANQNCSNGMCVTPPPVCSPANCTGCCINNACQPGNTATNCGASGNTCQVCPGTQSCMNGSCQTVCNPVTCPSGCCMGNVCQGGTSTSSCGSGGSACATCGATMTCTNQSCTTPGNLPGELCTGPVQLSVGTTAGTTIGYVKNTTLPAATTCTGTNSGVDRFYAITVQSGQTLTVVSTSGTGVDTFLNIIEPTSTSCTAPSMCVSKADQGNAGGIDTLTFTNTGTSQAFLLMVGTWGGANGVPGTFTLQTTLTGGMPMMSIPAACEGFTASISVNSILADDAVSSSTPIGFPFAYFGAPATHFSMSSNGNVQLFASAGLLANNDYQNVTMPSSATPNALVAIYWDDLSGSGATANARYQIFGTAPNRRLVVDWTNFVLRSTTSTLTMQAKFFETTNAIEFHYCSMAASANGISATIGLEDSTGTNAILTSFNSAGAVATGSGIRFVQ